MPISKSLQEKLYNIKRDAQDDAFYYDPSIAAIADPPFIHSTRGYQKGAIKIAKGRERRSTMPHERFHQAQYLADLVAQRQIDPRYTGLAEAGHEIGNINDPAVREIWKSFVKRHDLTGIPIHDKSPQEYPAYAFTSDPHLSLSGKESPIFKQWLANNQSKAYNEYEKMVRSRNPTVANILNQETYPGLVRRNLETQPVPVPMQIPQVKYDYGNDDLLVNLLKQVIGKRKK